MQTSQTLPRVLSGFEHINRYWDPVHRAYAAKLLPGEYYVTVENEIIVTVLGSCVSACIHDPIRGIGGMNHFMLPASQQGDEDRWQRGAHDCNLIKVLVGNCMIKRVPRPSSDSTRIDPL